MTGDYIAPEKARRVRDPMVEIRDQPFTITKRYIKQSLQRGLQNTFFF